MKQDSAIRIILKKGKFRNKIAYSMGFFIGILILILMHVYSHKPENPDEYSFISSALQSIGVVAALLSALAYNLKQQNISYYIKSIDLGYELHSPNNTARILTNLVTLSFFASTILILTSCFIRINWIIGIFLISFAAGLVSVCAVHYIYTLFAQEKLEEEFIKIINKSFIDSVTRGTSTFHKD